MAKQIKVEDIDLPEIEVFEPGSTGTDLSEFDGVKSTIWKYEKIDMPTSYDENGQPLPAGQTRPSKRLKVYTQKVTELTNAQGEIVPVYATELFALKERDGKWGISTHEKSKVQKLLNKVKAKTLPEIIGKPVVIRARENDKGNTFLGFYI